MNKLSKGKRKHIRKEKARIRKEIEEKSEQKEKIEELYQKFAKNK